MLISALSVVSGGLQDVPASVIGPSVRIGGLQARFALTPDDLAQVQALRGLSFFPDKAQPRDHDRFDSLSAHLMVCDPARPKLLATARLRLLRMPAEFANTYTAQYYDLDPIMRNFTPALEIGRLCHADETGGFPLALRVLFAALTRLVLHARAEVIFGCASFHGADLSRHRGILAWLRANHLGPDPLRPESCSALSRPLPDAALAPPIAGDALPALLRVYLSMGAWVAEHAVVDPALNTAHVFTALPVAAVSAQRRRALTALASLPAGA